MDISKIHEQGNIKFDPYLVETLVKETKKVKSDDKEIKTEANKIDWQNKILQEGITKLENSIQSKDDTSPLSYNSAPVVETMKEAQKVMQEINTDDLVKNIDDIFSGLNVDNILELFSEEVEYKV